MLHAGGQPAPACWQVLGLPSSALSSITCLPSHTRLCAPLLFPAPSAAGPLGPQGLHARAAFLGRRQEEGGRQEVRARPLSTLQA